MSLKKSWREKLADSKDLPNVEKFTGIFAWVAANAAEEMASEGKKRITPY